MTLLIVAFVAGVLTVLAPCILPMIPVIIGGALGRGGTSVRRPMIITASLTASIVVFTLLLKASASLLGVPAGVWQAVSGGIVVLFGISMVWPRLWEEIMIRSQLQARSNQLLGKATHKKGIGGDILLGMALGPVFSSCSPTFALIVAAVLPADFATGLLYLAAYALGLSLTLLLIILVGQSVIHKLGWALHPHSTFVRIIGIAFIIVGIGLITGADKYLQAWIIDRGWYGPIEHIELLLRH